MFFIVKRPTDDTFNDGLSIHKFAARVLPDHVMNVVDRSLLLETDGDGDDYDETYGNNIQERPITRYCDRAPLHATRFEECLVSVMQIGISCSAMSPGERMPMAVVVNQMKTIRDDGKF